MAINNFNDITDMHKSMLQEICNIGMGNAATSVSQMIAAPTDIGVPQVKINPPSLAGTVADMLSKSASSYLINLQKDVLGSFLFVFPYPFIERVAGNFFPDIKINDESNIDEMISSVLCETVNLSAAAYANSIANMTGLTVDITPPEPVKLPSEKILTSFRVDTPQVCFVDNSIEIVDCHKSYKTLFYPELDSINKIMEKFGF